MASIEVHSSLIVCPRCGTGYSKRSGYFSVSYAPLYKGTGFISVCKNCVDSIYNNYYAEYKDVKLSVRMTCRKLDLYWSDKLFDGVNSKATQQNIMMKYVARLNSGVYIGKCYDDTLREESGLSDFSVDKIPGKYINEHDDEDETPPPVQAPEQLESCEEEEDPIITDDADVEITDDIVKFWGSGYPQSMYKQLESRRRYWMSKLPDGIDDDIGTEALIRQICSLELDINRDRMAGKSIEKSVNALINVLGSANLKPVQRKEEVDNQLERTPMGVWIWRLENERPVSEISPEFEDVDGIKRYITTWFFGHLCKMLGIKNSYCKLYEEEIAKMRVERPEYDDEDDDSMLYDIFSNKEDEDV